MNATKSYDEIIDFIAAGTTPETVVAFHPSQSVQQRVAELVERSKEGSISTEDQSELEDYLLLEHIMVMAKARARQRTQLENLRSGRACIHRLSAKKLQHAGGAGFGLRSSLQSANSFSDRALGK